MNEDTPWRKARKETPEKGQKIVIAVSYRNPKTNVRHYLYDVTTYDRWDDGYGWQSEGEVHFWMPLPELPEY